jgi:hypothetical protein
MVPLVGYTDRSHNRYDNAVSRILKNVIDRFRFTAHVTRGAR